jgi:TRAP-type C4-dicarboxylate transport system permease small subunit
MERLYLACIVVSAVALVAITLVIPYGVFMRYVMNSASSWPEPFSVLAMVLFSFVGGAAAYRAGAHICVQMLTDAVPPAVRGVMLKLADLMMVATASSCWSEPLVRVTWNQTIGLFLSVGLTYSPIRSAACSPCSSSSSGSGSARRCADLDRLPRPAARRLMASR